MLFRSHVIKLEAEHQHIASGAWAGSVDAPDVPAGQDESDGEDVPDA